MTDILRIKRRTTGLPGAPASVANAELAYNEVDHILYYGEGGTSITAGTVVAIAGQGLASSALPIMDSAAAAGSASTWARADHVHPSDTSRAPLASPIFTGAPSLPTGSIGVTQAPGNSSTALATTAFVTAAGNATVVSFNTRTGAVVLLLADVTGVGGAPLASPVFTGAPSLPTGTIAVTQANGINNTTVATTAYVLATRQDQFQPPNVDVSWNSHRITNLLDPQNPQDASTKNYVDNAINGIVGKAPCRVATTGSNLAALSGLLVIDGITTVAGDRVLVKDQTTQSANGVYIAAAGAWARSTDTNTWAELVSAYVFVEVGAVNSDNGYLCTVDPGGTLGTTAVTWVQFSGAGQVIAGNGLSKVGNTLSVVGTAGQIAVGAAVSIDPTYVGQTSITTLGSVATGTWNGTTIAVARGGTGATTLTGYLVGNGTGAFTAVASIPSSGITGLGTMSTQNANAVAITGGTIDGVTFDCGTF